MILVGLHSRPKRRHLLVRRASTLHHANGTLRCRCACSSRWKHVDHDKDGSKHAAVLLALAEHAELLVATLALATLSRTLVVAAQASERILVMAPDNLMMQSINDDTLLRMSYLTCTSLRMFRPAGRFRQCLGCFGQ